MNDPHVTEVSEATQEVDGTGIPAVRIPSFYPVKQRYLFAEPWIEDFQPDWISLQFVPFSFHPKGLPVWLSSGIKRLKKEYKLHIMFHELWVGVNGVDTFKMRVLGALQKLLIKELIKSNTPHCITTSIPIYQQALSRTNSSLLPIFGNIPIAPAEAPKGTQESLKVVHFGSYTDQLEEFEAQVQFLHEVAKLQGKGLEFLSFGNGGPFKDKAIRIAAQVMGEEKVKELGLLSEQQISDLFQRSTVGISKSDLEMHGKSGSTIAMLEHGLPVVLRGRKPNLDNSPLYYSEYRDQIIFCDSDASQVFQKKPIQSTVGKTARHFIELLYECENKQTSYHQLKQAKEPVV